MVKNFSILIFLIFILGCNSKKLTIEQLSTNRQVAKFLKSNVDKKYSYEYVFDKEKAYNDEEFNWFVKKSDLNGNGYLDLIVDDFETIIVLNLGNGNYKELILDLYNSPIGFSESIDDGSTVLDTIITIEGQKLLVFNQEEQLNYSQPGVNFDTSRKIIKTDTLTIKYGELLTFNNSNKKDLPKVQSLEFETSYCYGVCPVFKIKIQENVTYQYNGIDYVELKGNKTGALKPEIINNLLGIVEYEQLFKLQDHYGVNMTDLQTVELKIIYNDGSVKAISDYGKNGTRSLRLIYKKLFEIKDIINSHQ